MTESATTQAQNPALKIDTTTKYAINAGKCDHCGNFKTWDFRIKNPKSGKMMPGHVTKDGFKINNGDCPYWAAIRNKKRNGDGYGNDGNGGGTVTTTERKATPAETAILDQHANYGQLSFSKNGQGATIRVTTMHPVVISLSRNEALKVARDLIDQFL